MFLVLSVTSEIYAQSVIVPAEERREKNTFRICFYNLENFFDYENNPAKNDDAFTPEGDLHWTKSRFWKKANDLSKVFIALGQWDLPDIIGVCEIENETAIEQLLYKTPLQKGNYKYVYYGSPDRRGINTALFYRSDKFRLIDSYPVSLQDNTDTSYRTRDILYVRGVLLSSCKDTLHLFVNHWSSQYGGYSATMNRRNKAGQILRQKADAILQSDSNSRIIAMGDFNNNPDDESMTIHLRAPYQLTACKQGDFINMMYPYFGQNNTGTHKYREQWSILDQILVSPALYNEESGLHIKNTAQIFTAEFLLEEDKTHLGKKPFRTYLGFRYQGGFSDHLPVYIDLQCD
jgi:endonuclease/exonuclease/phosphatase family metal-dependent hydrolase